MAPPQEGKDKKARQAGVTTKFKTKQENKKLSSEWLKLLNKNRMPMIRLSIQNARPPQASGLYNGIRTSREYQIAYDVYSSAYTLPIRSFSPGEQQQFKVLEESRQHDHKYNPGVYQQEDIVRGALNFPSAKCTGCLAGQEKPA